MLIRFVVENFLSFRDETVFEMLASRDQSHKDHIFEDSRSHLSLLRSAALYGANASGKSNLVRAISFARDLIVGGTKGDEAIETVPFRLDAKAERKPSKFEFTFRHEGAIYTYGFKLTSKTILEEWLFSTPNTREVLYFERVTPENGKAKVEFGPSFAGKSGSKNRQFFEFVAKGTRRNQLLLTEAGERNSEQARTVISWFESVLQIVTAESVYSGLEIVAHKNKSFTNYLGKVLNSAGTGIDSVRTQAMRFNFDEMFGDMPDEMRKEIKSTINQGENTLVSGPRGMVAVTPGKDKKPTILKLLTEHSSADGTPVYFEIENESDGTIRLMHLIPILFNSKFKELVFVIDELDRRLHPVLSREFVRSFLAREDGKGAKGQLIFTTHDTNLLNAELLRNDEIWFVEKAKAGSSHLYSLADFKIRKGLKIEKGYLNGRFGAIPFVGDLQGFDLSDE